MTSENGKKAPDTAKQKAWDEAAARAPATAEKRPLETAASARAEKVQVRLPEAPSKGHAADADALVPSFAEMWATVYAAPKYPMWPMKVMALCLFVIIAGMVIRRIGVPWLGRSLGGALSMGDTRKALQASAEREAWVHEVLSRTPTSVLQGTQNDLLDNNDAPVPAPIPRRGRPALAQSAAKKGLEGQAPEQRHIHPLFKKVFGSGKRLGSDQPLSVPAPLAAASQASKSVTGLQMHARLEDRVASSPSQAPVVARLVRPMRLGPHALAAGTQLNGRIVGGDDTRVFIHFDSIRLPNETLLAFQGVARAADGRVGLPGKKRITHHTTHSVGLHGLTRGLGELGRELAGTAGGVAGAGLRGVTESATRKAERLDRDEYVVIVEPGMMLNIFVHSVGGA